MKALPLRRLLPRRPIVPSLLILPWLASAVLGVSLMVAPRAEAELCPPPDGAACFVRCRLHKAECADACRADKKQCVLRVRAALQECKLGCRNEATGDGDVSVCKRECVAKALELARSECNLGKRSCVDTCSPDTCRELCGGVADPSADALASEPTDPSSDPGCEPPIDRECLGQCATELRECAVRVEQAGRACLEDCSALRGQERWHCVGSCAAATLEHGGVCRERFGGCAADCPTASPLPEPPAVD